MPVSFFIHFPHYLLVSSIVAWKSFALGPHRRGGRSNWAQRRVRNKNKEDGVKKTKTSSDGCPVIVREKLDDLPFPSRFTPPRALSRDVRFRRVVQESDRAFDTRNEKQ